MTSAATLADSSWDDYALFSSGRSDHVLPARPVWVPGHWCLCPCTCIHVHDINGGGGDADDDNDLTSDILETNGQPNSDRRHAPAPDVSVPSVHVTHEPILGTLEPFGPEPLISLRLAAPLPVTEKYDGMPVPSHPNGDPSPPPPVPAPLPGLRTVPATQPDPFCAPHLTDVLRYLDVVRRTFAWSLPRLELLLGYPPSAVEPATDWWRALLHTDDRQRVVRSLQRFVADRALRFWAEAYKIRAADGQYVTVVDQLAAVARDPATGRALRCVGAMFSVVQRQQVEDILAGPRAKLLRDVQKPKGDRSESARLLKTVTDNSTSGLFMMDSNGPFTEPCVAS